MKYARAVLLSILALCLVAVPARAEEECVPARGNCILFCAEGYSCRTISDNCGGKIRACVKDDDDEEGELLPAPGLPRPVPPPPPAPKPPKKQRCTQDGEVCW